MVLNSQKTSCITSRLNSTPEFRTRGTPQLFAHPCKAQLLTARDPQHDRFTPNAAQFRSVHEAYASIKPTIMHRGQGTRARCIRTGHNHAPLPPTRFSTDPNRVDAHARAPAPRAPSHAALPLLTMADLGSANTERGHTSEALWHKKA